MSVRIPLLAAQEGIWVGQALDLRSGVYATAESVELVGPVHMAALADAVSQALGEAEVVRTCIGVSAEGRHQEFCSELSVAPRLIELSDASEAMAWMAREARVGFDLSRGPLARQALLHISDRHVFWFLAAHHIALDGFAYSLIMQRAAQLYAARLHHRPVTSSPFSALSATMEDDLAYRSSVQHELDGAFWRERLQDMPDPGSLAERVPRYASLPRKLTLDLDAAALAALDLYREARGPGWVQVLSALFVGFVQQRTAASEVTLGLPVMARRGKVALRSPTMMMNIVPLRLTVRGEPSLRACAERVGRELASSLPHSLYRHEQLRRDLTRLGGDRRLFGAVLNIMPFARTLQFGDAAGNVSGIAAGPVEDLSLSVHPLPARAGLRLSFDAHPEAYSEVQLQQLAQDFGAFTREHLNEPERPLIPDDTKSEDRLLVGAPLDRPARDPLALIISRALDAPESTAIEHGEQTTSYRELVLRARALAENLTSRGVAEGSLVALYLPRSRDAVVAMLAVLSCNAGYIPLDPAGPVERNVAVLRDARPTLVVTADGPLPRLLAGQQVLTLHDAELADHLPTLREVAPGAPAYVIYTSGSTGQPNGVVVGRGALTHYTAAASQRYDIVATDRVLQFAPLAFDASVEEIYVTLSRGATLVLRSDDMVQSAAHFLQQSERLGLTVLGLPTAFFHELAYATAHGGPAFPAAIHTVIIGGEAALPERVRQFRNSTGDRIRLLNTYGPTETTVVATCADLAGPGAAFADGELPIGLPVPGVSAILRKHAQHRSEPSYELLLCGPSLAIGYLGRPELTAERFVDLGGQGRAYRTGDLVGVRADGQLTFQGRADQQLKISGHRVELGEVESVLTRCPGVREVVVVVHTSGGQPRLVAHVVPDSAELSLDTLREHAQQHLLKAALPSRFALHHVLPRTATGKVDRKQLSEQASQPFPTAQELPASVLEGVVLEVWCEVLGSQQLSLTQDFFELGGQSLQSIQVATRLSVRLGREIAGALLFRHPTIRSLARALDETGPGEQNVDDDERQQLLDDATLALSTRAARRLPGRRGDVLLTGASGFLGVHLLHTLLMQSDLPITCVVRAEHAQQANERLHAAMRAQKLPTELLGKRVRAVAGDLTKPLLGLSSTNHARLVADCQLIVHNGASVSLARGYTSLRTVNVNATRALIELARASGAELHYVSTLATALSQGKIEERFVDHHAGLGDGYSRSKWVSERLLAQARELGTPVKIYRLGRLVGARETATVNRDDLVWRLIAAGLAAGALPMLGVREPWSPVDVAARVIVAASFDAQAEGPVFNLAPDQLVSLDDVMRWIAGYGYQTVACQPAQFRARLGSSTGIDPGTLAMFDAQSGRAIPSIESIDTAHTQEVMARAQLDWPEIRKADVHRYLATCIAQGIVVPPKSPRESASRSA